MIQVWESSTSSSVSAEGRLLFHPGSSLLCGSWVSRTATAEAQGSLQPPGGPVGTVYWCLPCWNPLPSSVRFCRSVASLFPCSPSTCPVPDWDTGTIRILQLLCLVSEGSGHCLWFIWLHAPFGHFWSGAQKGTVLPWCCWTGSSFKAFMMRWEARSRPWCLDCLHSSGCFCHLPSPWSSTSIPHKGQGRKSRHESFCLSCP